MTSVEAIGYAYDKGVKQAISNALEMIDDVLNDLDSSWCSKKVYYEHHECNGQDGNDIAFTKKDFERIISKLKKIKEL
ncbi:hypothetical protein MUP35_01910 [Patescibacteria group bacterium]|nr:hypothetical protein [Patescibacteria group bacterium]